MRDEDKPFACYRDGLGMKIVPRGAVGWRAFGWWMASLFLLVGLFITVLAMELGEAWEIVAVVGFLCLTGVWTFAMIRWMMARSEVIDLARPAKEPRRRGSRRRS